MSDKIKKVVRHYVKQVLAEEFAKMNLSKLVEKMIKSKMDEVRLKESFDSNRSAYTASAEKVVKEAYPKVRTATTLGIDENVWKNVYADIAQSGNPILQESTDEYDEPTADKPEHVSEDVLQRMGWMKDYSQHIGQDKTEKQLDKEKEHQDLQMKRLEMLNKNIVRGV